MIRKIFSLLLRKAPFRVKTFLYRSLLANLNNAEKQKLGLTNLSVGLLQLRKLGYEPNCIIDIGAHNGDWTNEVNKIYTNSKFVLIEALPQKAEILKTTFQQHDYKIFNCLVGDANKDRVPFFSMETGSSVMEELTSFPRETIYLPMRTLDSLTDKLLTGDNNLLKIDVQGFELFVLKGATETLRKIEAICLEVSFLNYNSGAPLIDEVISSLKGYGFVAFDFISFFRKSTDHALIQADMLFIRKDSHIRNLVNDFKKAFSVVQY